MLELRKIVSNKDEEISSLNAKIYLLNIELNNLNNYNNNVKLNNKEENIFIENN